MHFGSKPAFHNIYISTFGGLGISSWAMTDLSREEETSKFTWMRELLAYFDHSELGSDLGS
jgi:hypothetical protein